VISKEGFQTFSAQGVAVAVGQVVRVDAALRVGAVSETIAVTAESAVLQTDRAEVRSEVSAKQLENLPMPLGRSYENLLITVPGLSPPANQHSVAVNPARGLTFSAMGTTRNSNSVRIEGAIARGMRIVALDERGTSLTTKALAARLQAWQGEGDDVALVIGGPDAMMRGPTSLPSRNQSRRVSDR